MGSFIQKMKSGVWPLCNFVLLLLAMGTFLSCGDDLLVGMEEPVSKMVITGFEPDSGVAGHKVEIEGKFFVPNVGNQGTIRAPFACDVSFNGIPAEIEYISQEDSIHQRIVTHVPEGAATGKISVEREGMMVESEGDFVIFSLVYPVDARPVIDYFAPSATCYGKTVNIYGNGFMPVIPAGTFLENYSETSISFNGITALSYTLWQGEYDRQRISVILPEGANDGRITVVAGGHTVTSTEDFYVTFPDLHPNATASVFVNTGSLLDVAVDAEGSCYGSSSPDFTIYKFSPDGERSIFRSFIDERYAIIGMAVDKDLNVYFTDINRVFKVFSDGSYVHIAGTEFGGDIDGAGVQAKFNILLDIEIDDQGNLYVLDSGNNKVRKIDTEGNVSTVAGGVEGYQDGHVSVAKFANLHGLDVDVEGNIFVADEHRIRKISPDGMVSTVAGNDYGFRDGGVAEALFYHPYDVAVDRKGNLFITDSSNDMIRMIRSDGRVITLATLNVLHQLGIDVGPDGDVFFTQGGGSNGLIKIAFGQ